MVNGTDLYRGQCSETPHRGKKMVPALTHMEHMEKRGN